MSFYVRKSLRAGPFRLNLSRSGIGVSAGIPGFRVGSGPRGNYVRVDVAGVHYQTALVPKQRGRHGVVSSASPPQRLPMPSDVIMLDTTGTDATRLEPTGPGDLVTQLNQAARRHLWWPWLATAVIIVAAVTGIAGLVVLALGAVGVVWLALWERARRSVVAFYDVTGPAATWFQGLVDGYPTLARLGGAWRIQASGAVRGTHQYKINSGASNIVNRVAASFTLTTPTTLVTNIAVPCVRCGRDALLFLPDRLLVRSGRSWSDVAYSQLRISMNPTRFIESGRVPRDSSQVGITWQYVNVKGGPDRRFKNNRQLPIMLYGKLELWSATGLRWIIDCSRVEAAGWLSSTIAAAAPVLPSATPAPPMPQPWPPEPLSHRPSIAAPPRILMQSSRTAVQPAPFATPGRRGALFAYADLLQHGGLAPHDGPYAVIDVETTGLSAARGDRIVEIAIARIDAAGRIEDEYATLINPDGRDTGPVFIHGISNDAVNDAPRFPDIAAEILNRLDGCVVVAHNAPFEEGFLAAELRRARITVGPLPALCTLRLAQQTLTTPNFKLATLARHAGVAMPDQHAALGDVRAVAALLPLMLTRLARPLAYPCAPLAPHDHAHLPAPTARIRTRAINLRRGSDGWMASILARLPMSAADAADATTEAYLSALSIALEDGRIVGDEARALADLAGAAGLGAAQVAELNQRFLESLREAAFEDNILTAAELKQLRTAAKALAVPDYFDDLNADPALNPIDMTTKQPTRPRRCGHCRTIGHYRSTCPQLRI